MVVGGLQAHSISHMGQVYSILRHKHVAWCCFGSKLLFCEGGTCVCAQSLQSCLTLCNPMDISPSGSSDHGDSPGKNTRVDCHALLQGIFPTQGLNLCLLHLLHCRWIFLHSEPLRKPCWRERMLKIEAAVLYNLILKIISNVGYWPHRILGSQYLWELFW